MIVRKCSSSQTWYLVTHRIEDFLKLLMLIGFQVEVTNLVLIEGNSVLYQAHSELYWHWLFDDLMGLWWLLTEHSIIPKHVSIATKWSAESLFITLEGKLSSHLEQLEYFFTNRSYQVTNLKDNKILGSDGIYCIFFDADVQNEFASRICL